MPASGTPRPRPWFRSTSICSRSSFSTGRRWHSRISPCNGWAARWIGCCGRAARARPFSVRLPATRGPRRSRRSSASRARDVYILYPQGRVSEVQRRQMTTVGKPNVHALAIEGTFDDCQRIVKELFGDLAFRDEMNLSGVNSINWARILAQIVYYFVSAVALGAPERPVSFAVPTGNFGDVLAGYYAKRMGLPIERLIVATNENDILARALASGRYEPRGVKPTQSPSMDIQVSSNFERLLFEVVRSGPGSNPRVDVRVCARRRVHDSRAGPGAHSRRFRRHANRRSGLRRGNGPRLSRERRRPRSAQRHRRRRRAKGACRFSRDSGHRARHGPSGQVPRRGRARHWRAARRCRAHLADLMDRKETIVVLPNDRNAVADYLRQTARAPA